MIRSSRSSPSAEPAYPLLTSTVVLPQANIRLNRWRSPSANAWSAAPIVTRLV
jgi:hypothetical protein